jgi:hypothetical protein
MIDPSTIGEFADDIYTAIRNATPPVGLAGILAYVDMRQRVLLTREELNQALRGLIDAGLIVEVEPHHYRDAAGEPGNGSFSGVSDAAHAAACDEYRQLVEQVLADDREYPANLTIFLPSGGEPLAEAIAGPINQALADRGGDDILPVGGFLTDGATYEMQVFALTDDLLDAILPTVIEALATSTAPPGSTIARWNEDRKEDVIIHRIGED